MDDDDKQTIGNLATRASELAAAMMPSFGIEATRVEIICTTQPVDDDKPQRWTAATIEVSSGDEPGALDVRFSPVPIPARVAAHALCSVSAYVLDKNLEQLVDIIKAVEATADDTEEEEEQ